MGFSPLADMKRRIPDIGRSSARLDKIDGLVIHHNAGVDAFGQATAPGREVGAQYWITNAGATLPHVDETRRAFTSGAVGYPAGAAADHRSITVEVSNSGGAPGWPISKAAEDALARLIGDVHRRYKLGKVTRATVRVHRDFVPTECPGPHIMDNLDRIIAAAERYRRKETSMLSSEEAALLQRIDRNQEELIGLLKRMPNMTAKELLGTQIKLSGQHKGKSETVRQLLAGSKTHFGVLRARTARALKLLGAK